jgi:uncharacterized protein involved in exopolysaccharide biosynthesis
MISESKDNQDVKQHVLSIEAKLDRLALSPRSYFESFSSRGDDEIDLRELWNALWLGKWRIIGITFLFTVGAVIWALSMPNKYKAEVVLAPAQKDGGISSLAEQYGGLAAMAGINLGRGQSSDIDQAIALVKSRPFLEAFLEKYDIKPEIVAVKGWDGTNDEALYDADLFDPTTRQWMEDSGSKESLEPSNFKAYRALSDMLSISRDAKSGLTQLSVEHYVPKLAYEWVQLFVQELNRHFQERDMRDASRNIEYLQGKADNTSIAEMQSVFYRMIESQMKTLMLAEVSGDYLLKPVIPASLPAEKSSPKRALICVIGVLMGAVLSIMLIVILYLAKPVKHSK